MAITPAVLQPGVVLPVGNTQIVLAQGTSTVIIKQASFTNVSALTANFSVFVVRAGSATDTFVVFGQNVTPGQCYKATELNNLVLAPGDSLFAFPNVAGAISCVASGYTM